MAKIGFIGFGEVNTPVDVIIRKCSAAEAALKAEGLDLVSVDGNTVSQFNSSRRT